MFSTTLIRKLTWKRRGVCGEYLLYHRLSQYKERALSATEQNMGKNGHINIT